jgi:uncharacterized membrane protein HdeD (DUF308 family)
MKLHANEGPLDRIARIALGVVLIAAGAFGWVAAPIVYLAWVVGAIALVTGVVGFCALYRVFGISTNPAGR